MFLTYYSVHLNSWSYLVKVLFKRTHKIIFGAYSDHICYFQFCLYLLFSFCTENWQFPSCFCVCHHLDCSLFLHSRDARIFLLKLSHKWLSRVLKYRHTKSDVRKEKGCRNAAVSLIWVPLNVNSFWTDLIFLENHKIRICFENQGRFLFKSNCGPGRIFGSFWYFLAVFGISWNFFVLILIHFGPFWSDSFYASCNYF